MVLFFYIAIFLISCFLIYVSGELVVNRLMGIARFFRLREFVVALLTMAFAGSLPNLFLGISAILHHIPRLAFGDIIGGNVVDLSLTLGVAALIVKNLPTESRMVQTSAIFTVIIAVLPLLLILDGTLGRGDALVLILIFIIYFFWLFYKKERFKKIYRGYNNLDTKTNFLSDIKAMFLGFILLLVATEGIIRSAEYFAYFFKLDIGLIGLLVVGLGNSLPEIYFTIASSKRGQTWMTLGNLMGSIIVPATLVLGIVAFISPITIPDFSPFAVARIFLILAAFLFYFVIWSGRKITRKEAIFLILIYVAFLVTEILIK